MVRILESCEYVGSRREYNIYKCDDGSWYAIKTKMGNEVGDPISITYNQARGIDPIDDGEKIGMKVGKALGMRNIRKTESKKVTESFFRDSFEDWYDFLDEDERVEVDQYMEDEGMPDMVTDLSRTDMENVIGHFDPDRLEDLYDQEDEGNRIKGGWQFDEGPYEEGYKKTESSTGETSYTVEYETVDGDENWTDITVEPTTGEYLFDSGYIEGYDSNSISMIYNDNVDPSPLVNKEIEIYDGDKYLATIKIISVEKAWYNYTESKKTEASRMDNEFYGGGTVYVGLYGDDCGPYGSLDGFKSALKKANIKILDVSGDEEYGWDMIVKGIAKEIYKLVDGKIPGYNCDDVMEFIEEYSLDPEEFEDHDDDLYSAERLSKDIPDEAFESYDEDESPEPAFPDDYDPDEDEYPREYFVERKSNLLGEDTVKKSNGKWTNKGKDGEHGEFKTKKAADAQRKAMFANGYKGEAWGDSLRDAPNPYNDEDEEYSDFSDGSVRRGEKFIEDGIEYEWVDEASDVYYLDFDALQVWKAERTDDLEEAYFVVDKDTGFIDWGPCDTELEAVEFLHSKIDDYNNDEDEDDLMDGLLD